MPPSLARSLYDQLVSAPDPIAAIRALVAVKQVETDWLDFKTEPHNPQTWDKQLREMWCEALSGFANNQGGVLVWGIEAKKTKVSGVEIDAASGERMVKNPAAFKSRLTELQRGATDPPLANVEIQAYDLPSAPGTGFVLCFIPEGPFKPYRTEEGRRSQFCLRAGDNFVTMSRARVQALFYPRTQAQFKIEARLSWELERGSRPEPAVMNLHVDLANVGTATAKSVLMRVDHNVKPGSGVKTEPWRAGPGWNMEGHFAKLGPIHPKMPASTVFSWQWRVPTTTAFSAQNRVVPNCPNPAFRFEVYSENQEPQFFKVKFDLDILRDEQRWYPMQATPVEEAT